jgi:DnaJ-domain-containing protein 1
VSATERVSALIEITKRLGQVIQQETQLLKQRRPADLVALQAEKTQLGAAYEEELSIVGKNSDFLAKEAPTEMKELQTVVSWFRKILDEHGRVLAAAKVVTERMVRNISEEVARKDRPDAGYSRYAQKPRLSRGSRPVSLAINQVV